MRLHVLGLFGLLAVAAPPALASRGPDFDVDGNSWDATDIVVVSEGETIDGHVKVLETLAGSIAVEEELTIPDLARYAPVESRTVHWTGSDWDCPAVVVSGTRMLLFLVRQGSELAPAHAWGRYATSTAWFEDGKAYARGCVTFPGQPVLLEHGSEAAMRARVLEVRALKQRRREALALKDPTQRARGLRPIMDLEVAREGTLDGLVGCGATATPVFRELLDDPTLDVYPVIAALCEAAGDDAVPVLVGFLDRAADRLEVAADPAAAWSRPDDPEKHREAWAKSRRDSVQLVIRNLSDAPDPRRWRAVVERLHRLFRLQHADPGLLSDCTQALGAADDPESGRRHWPPPRPDRSPHLSRRER